MKRRTKKTEAYLRQILLEDGFKENQIEGEINGIFSIVKEFNVTVEEALAEGGWDIYI